MSLTEVAGVNDLALGVGTRIARSLFAHRGNHTEVHVNEAEVAALVTLGIEVFLRETRVREHDALKAQLQAAEKRTRPAKPEGGKE